MSGREQTVLLINPWILDFAAYDFWSKPTGLLTIAAVLMENGYRIELLDCMDRKHRLFEEIPFTGRSGNPIPAKGKGDGTGHYYKEIIQKPPLFKTVPRRYGRYGVPLSLIKKELEGRSKPDLIMMTSGMTYWYPGVVEMTSLLRELFGGVPVILGGIYATLCHEHAKRVSGADGVVKGEGENQAVRLADELTGRRSPKVHYENLDEIPLLPYSLYDSLDSAVILTSRGCPYRCPFCASHLLCSDYQRRKPGKVVEEIAGLHRSRGVRNFAFYDDALLYDRQNHFVPLLEELIDRHMDISLHTPNGIHPKWVDGALAGLMKRAGFKTVRLSYESGNPTRQKSMGLKVTDDDLSGAVDSLLEAGFNRSELGGYVIMGLPDQGLDEILDSLCFVFRLGIKVSAASFSPIPGTPSWDEAVRGGFVSDELDPLLMNNSIFPMKSGTVGYPDFVRLGTLAALGNRIVLQGGMPLENPEFRRSLKTFDRKS